MVSLWPTYEGRAGEKSSTRCRSATATETPTATPENRHVMSEIRYLLDENVNPAFRTALLQYDHCGIVL